MDRGPVLFAYGFRMFFLGAGILAVLAMLGWMAWLAQHALGGQIAVALTPFPAILWHAHEMIFGYAAAVIAGFLLTASANWAGAPPVAGKRLAALVLLWLAGRLVQAFGAGLPPLLVDIVDLAFLPALAWALAATLWGSPAAKRNLIFVPVLMVLFAADLMIHLEVRGASEETAATGLRLAVNTVILLLVVFGGRITPAFTGNAFKVEGIDAPIRIVPMLERAAVASVVLVLLADLIVPGSSAVAWVAAAAAILQLLRLSGWQTPRIRNQPILWVLHLGYLWIVAGLALKAAAGFSDLIPASAATHALTVGAIGTYTLGMMSRVALGHTGRPLLLRPAIVAAYGLVSLAAIVRIAAPVAAPDLYSEAMIAAAGLWTVAFAAFVWVYLPILIAPRPDGNPG